MDPLADLRLENQPLIVRLYAWLLRNRRWLLLLTSAALLGVALLRDPFELSLVFVSAFLIFMAFIATTKTTQGLSLAPAVGTKSWGLLLMRPFSSPHRGDIVFVTVPGLRPLAKRVAALPGETLSFREGGVFLKVGDEWKELPLTADLSQFRPNTEVLAEVHEGHYFLLGDHVASIDSRHFGAVPLKTIIGKYTPLLHSREIMRPGLSVEETTDLELARVERPPFLPRLERMLEIGGWEPGHLVLALYRTLMECGALERVDSLLERAWKHEATDRGSRELWTNLLADLHTDRDPSRALEAVERHLDTYKNWDDNTLLEQRRALLLCRLERWDEALEAESRYGDQHGAPGIVAARISALLGLARLDDAREELEGADADGSWAHPSHAPYYRGLLEAAGGHHAEAAQLLLRALDDGFTDPRLIRTTPHLAAFRESSSWESVSKRVGIDEPLR